MADHDWNETKTYDTTVVLDSKKGEGIIPDKRCYKEMMKLYKKCIARVDVFVVGSNVQYVTTERQTKYIWNKIFNKGGIMSFYKYSTTTIFIAWLIILGVLLVVITKGSKIYNWLAVEISIITNCLLEIQPLDDILNKEEVYYAIYYGGKRCLILFQKDRFDSAIETLERDSIGSENEDAIHDYTQNLRRVKRELFYKDKGWVIDRDLLSKMGAKEQKEGTYKVQLLDKTGDKVFDLLFDYFVVIENIYPKR